MKINYGGTRDRSCSLTSLTKSCGAIDQRLAGRGPGLLARSAGSDLCLERCTARPGLRVLDGTCGTASPLHLVPLSLPAHNTRQIDRKRTQGTLKNNGFTSKVKFLGIVAIMEVFLFTSLFVPQNSIGILPFKVCIKRLL